MVISRHLAATVLLASGGICLVACGKQEAPKAPPAAATKGAAPVHEHKPPHGGTLIELGEEFAHVELLVDKATGGVTAYVLDGEAENPAPVAQRTLSIAAKVAGKDLPLVLDAVANALTGETVGNTSEFRGRSEALKGVDRFEASLETITVKGGTFTAVAFRFPEGNDEKAKDAAAPKEPGKGKE